VRVALLFPRNATVDNVLLKAVHVYNSYELACAAATTATTATAATGGGGGGGGDSVGDVSGTVSAMEGADQDQHQQQHQQQGTDRVNAEAEATAGAAAGAEAGLDSANSTNTATTGIVQRPGAGEGLVSPAVTHVVIPPQQQQQQQLCKHQRSAAVRLSEPPPRLPQLLVANAVLIDVNDKAKGRFGKMLDKKYVLHSVILLCWLELNISLHDWFVLFCFLLFAFYVFCFRETVGSLMDESTNECHLIVQERCKDIPYIASLLGTLFTATENFSHCFFICFWLTFFHFSLSIFFC
jgi:hypothetical protein